MSSRQHGSRPDNVWNYRGAMVELDYYDVPANRVLDTSPVAGYPDRVEAGEVVIKLIGHDYGWTVSESEFLRGAIPIDDTAIEIQQRYDQEATDIPGVGGGDD